jgi:hypothetical protein
VSTGEPNSLRRRRRTATATEFQNLNSGIRNQERPAGGSAINMVSIPKMITNEFQHFSAVGLSTLTSVSLKKKKTAPPPSHAHTGCEEACPLSSFLVCVGATH